MPRINTEHLRDIFGVVEYEINDSNLKEILNLSDLDSKAAPTNEHASLPFLLDKTGSKIRNRFFMSRRDVPRDEKHADTVEFNKISVFSVKLALLLEACKKLPPPENTEESKELTERCKKKFKEIIEEARELLANSTDPDVKLFLIRKLMLIHDLPQIKNDHDFIETIKPQLVLIIKNLCQNVTSDPQNLKALSLFKDIARFFNQYATVLNKDELFRTFIEATKSCFMRCQGPQNYRLRLHIIKAIHAAWELLQSKLSLADLNWLQEVSLDIDREYGKLPARYMKPVKILLDCGQYFKEWGGWVVGTGAVGGLLSWGTTKLSISFLASRIAALEAIKKYQSKLLDPTLEKAAKQQLENLINGGIKMLVPKDRTFEEFLANQQEFQKQFTGYASWFPWVAGGITAGVACLSIFRYARSPSEPRPVQLPGWVAVRQHALSSTGVAAITTGDHKGGDSKAAPTNATAAAAAHPVAMHGGPLAASTAAARPIVGDSKAASASATVATSPERTDPQMVKT